MIIAETFYSPKNEKFILQTLDPKNWLSCEISNPKTWHAHPPYANMTGESMTKNSILKDEVGVPRVSGSFKIPQGLKKLPLASSSRGPL